MRKIKLLLFGVALAALLALPGAAMAKSRDRDHDKLPDKWEQKFHLSTHHKSANGDPDRDGLSNMGEFRSHTNPRKADSNGDGTPDGLEDADNDGVNNQDEMDDHTNPSDSDSDNDGVKDGQEQSGTVTSFTEDSPGSGSGQLVITLTDGITTVSGRVDNTTRIECGHAGDNSTGTGGMSRHDSKDNSGPGSDNSDSGSDDGPNHDTGGDQGNDDEHGNCTTANLTPGAIVHEAELTGTGDHAVFEKIELLV